MLKPKLLQKGDTIGVISPASPSYKRSDVRRGLETLKQWGYKVVLSKNLNKRKGFIAGTDEERADDFNEMFSRKDIDAVFVTQRKYEENGQWIHHKWHASGRANVFQPAS